MSIVALRSCRLTFGIWSVGPWSMAANAAVIAIDVIERRVSAYQVAVAGEVSFGEAF